MQCHRSTDAGTDADTDVGTDADTDVSIEPRGLAINRATPTALVNAIGVVGIIPFCLLCVLSALPLPLWQSVLRALNADLDSPASHAWQAAEAWQVFEAWQVAEASARALLVGPRPLLQALVYRKSPSALPDAGSSARD